MENKLTKSWLMAMALGYATVGGATDSTAQTNIYASKVSYLTILCLGIFSFGTSRFDIFEIFSRTLQFVFSALFFSFVLQITTEALIMLIFQIAMEHKDGFSFMVLALGSLSVFAGYLILAKLELLPHQIANNHRKTMAQMEQDHGKAMVQMEQDHGKAMVQIEQDHGKAMVQMEQDHGKAMAEMECAHKERLKQIEISNGTPST